MSAEVTTVSLPGGKPVLLLAEYDSPAQCMKAAEKLRDAGFKHFDTHTPFPVHGMDGAMGMKDSKLGLIVSEIVLKNALKADAAKVRARVDEIAASYEDPTEVVSWYYSKPENLSNIEDVVVEDNVVEWVLAQAKTSERAVSFEELMGQQSQQ